MCCIDSAKEPPNLTFLLLCWGITMVQTLLPEAILFFSIPTDQFFPPLQAITQQCLLYTRVLTYNLDSGNIDIQIA